MNRNIKLGLVLLGAAIVMFFLTPFFPFDDLVLLVIGAVTLAKDMIK